MKIDWTGITIDNGQCEYPDCPHCARAFLAWYKMRMAQMHVPRKKMGETVPFSDAAATSVKPSKDDP